MFLFTGAAYGKNDNIITATFMSLLSEDGVSCGI